MARPKVFHYPNCSTCKKARKWLDAHGVDYELVDIVQAPPSKRQLQSALELAELPLRKLFNTSGQSYRNGGFKEKLKTMSDTEALASLAADGKLIKRPLVVAKDFALVGFREDEWKRAFS